MISKNLEASNIHVNMAPSGEEKMLYWCVFLLVEREIMGY